MLSRLDNLKKKLQSSGDNTVTSLYALIKELKCLPEIVGRDYEVFDKDGKLIYRIRQKPMKIPTLFTLFHELEADYERQQKASKKGRKK